MAAIVQTTFSIAFYLMKMYEFRLKFHWIINDILMARREATSRCLNQWWLVWWRIYASIGLNELRYLLSGQGLCFTGTLAYSLIRFQPHDTHAWQWRHISVMTSQITGNTTVCSLTCSMLISNPFHCYLMKNHHCFIDKSSLEITIVFST